MFEPRIYSQIAWPLCGATPSLCKRRRCVTRFAFFYRSATRGHTWFAVEVSNSASWSLSAHCWVSNDFSLLICYRTAPVEPSTCPLPGCLLSFWIGSPPFSSVLWQNNFSSVTVTKTLTEQAKSAPSLLRTSRRLLNSFS